MRKVEELIRIIVRTIVTIMLPTIVCSCQIGLGSQVDTEAPTLSISYPPVSAVIKDGFVIGGSWDDDQGVTKITVTVKNAAAASGTTGDSYTATINTTNKIWSLNLNAYGCHSLCFN